MATLEREPTFGTDRLTSALLDYGDRHAAFTDTTQSGSNAWGTHPQLSVLGGAELADRRCAEHCTHDRGVV